MADESAIRSIMDAIAAGAAGGGGFANGAKAFGERARWMTGGYGDAPMPAPYDGGQEYPARDDANAYVRTNFPAQEFQAAPEAAAPPAKASFGLGDTWPARIARSIMSAATLPGDVYQGNVSMTGDDGRTNPAVIDRAAELGGLMATGGIGGVPENALGSGLARMRMVGNADLFKELANQRRSAGMATGKSAAGWDFKRPDAPAGSWADLVARTQAQWATDKSRAVAGFQEAAPTAARVGESPYMTAADWDFIAKNPAYGVLLPGAAGAVLSRQNDGT